MSIKANFKRLALAVVVALSLGMLGTAPTNAGTIIGELLTVDGSSTSAASTIAQGETATVSVVNTFTPESVYDSVTVYTSCAAPAGASCYNLLDFFWTATTDSTTTAIGGGSINGQARDGSGTEFVQNTDDSFVIAGTTAGAAVRFTSNLKFRAATTTTAGAYTVTVYTKSSNGGLAAGVTATNKSVTWTVTVTAEATTVTSLNTYITPSLAQSAYWANTFATSKDSAIVASNGKSSLTGVVSYNAAAYINVNAKNTNGDTTTVARTNICSTACAITATVTNGPGLLSLSSVSDGSTGVRTLNTFRTDNSSATGAENETLVVWSDGTAGVSTITFYNSAGTQIGTASLTFTGAPASATSVSLSDTAVAISGDITVSAMIKDSAGNALPHGSTIYVYASDTKVVSAGARSTTEAQFAQYAAGVRGSSAGACTPNSDSATAGRYRCPLTISDTGTATITLRDSWTVAASTWVSDAVTVTGLGVSAASVAVSFDKATYQAGEKAVITITAKDLAGRAAAAATFTEVTSSMSLGNLLTGSTNTTASTAATVATFTDYIPFGIDSGIETRVVFMPATSGTVTFSIKYTPTSVATAVEPVTATASAVVTNPAEVAATAATAAAEAATDAANEAIDAANAATDAANLAAEAADAATVAAEEARDAADAATAAVEELATQVATLMAALSAQVKTLANTVAKIAKKVKA